VHALLGLTSTLDQSASGTRRFMQDMDWRRRENARPDKPMGQEGGNPSRIGFVHFMTRPPPYLIRIAYKHLERPRQYVIHGLPIDPVRSMATTGQCGSMSHSVKTNKGHTWSQTRARPASPGRRPGHTGDRRSDALDARQSRTYRMHHVHGLSLPPPLRTTIAGDDGAPAMGTQFPRMVDKARLGGVAQAERTDELPGCHPYKRMTPSTHCPLPPGDTSEDVGTQHISSAAGVETPPTWPINLTTPGRSRKQKST
jgi:hypothetical protein